MAILSIFIIDFSRHLLSNDLIFGSNNMHLIIDDFFYGYSKKLFNNMLLRYDDAIVLIHSIY